MLKFIIMSLSTIVYNVLNLLFFYRKQRKKMHSHLRQNLCVDHQNRNLANGPNHPGPLPEDIQMVDVRPSISKLI